MTWLQIPRTHIKPRQNKSTNTCNPSTPTHGDWKEARIIALAQASEPDNSQALSHTRLKMRTDTWGCPLMCYGKCTPMLWHAHPHTLTHKVKYIFFSPPAFPRPKLQLSGYPSSLGTPAQSLTKWLMGRLSSKSFSSSRSQRESVCLILWPGSTIIHQDLGKDVLLGDGVTFSH